MTNTHTHTHTNTHTHQCSAHKHQGPCLVPFVSDNLPKALLAVPASGDQVGCLGSGSLLNGLEWNPHRESSQISLSGEGRQGLEHMRDPELEKVLETAEWEEVITNSVLLRENCKASVSSEESQVSLSLGSNNFPD